MAQRPKARSTFLQFAGAKLPSGFLNRSDCSQPGDLFHRSSGLGLDLGISRLPALPIMATRSVAKHTT
jgi:hypothetical protein